MRPRETPAAAGTGTRARIGNDVVDLAHPRCRTRPAHDRLARRILDERETDRLERADDADERTVLLWVHWAAKETAFKVATKLRGNPPVFRHRTFVVDELRRKRDGGGLLQVEGFVRWKELDVRIEGSASRDFVHLVGWGPAERGAARPLLEMGVEGVPPIARKGFHPEEDASPDSTSAEEAAAAHGELSRRARRVARARLASHLKAGNDRGTQHRHRIQILTSAHAPGRTAPRIVVDGAPRPDLDVSLSHHGRYIGWAILLPG